MTPSPPFSGSYRAGEVEFLLRPVQMEWTSLEERERLIQSGERHYSEMIGPEDAPTRARMALFRECMARNGERFAEDLARLADALAASAREDSGELTLVSIARAGTPIGVILRHHLRQIAPKLEVSHYSISVIRDRGVDLAALTHILKRHSVKSIRFVDGWTGKGTIARELSVSIGDSEESSSGLDTRLWVPLDVCGAAGFSASQRDYLIPSTLLGGTISGLVSRSLLPNCQEFGPGYHGCMRLDHLRRYDISRWFVDRMVETLSRIEPSSSDLVREGDPARREAAAACLESLLALHGASDPNLIKLGFGETVRVLLRRIPKVVILRGPVANGDADIVTQLAAKRGVPVAIDSNLAFDAAAVIGAPPRRSGAPET